MFLNTFRIPRVLGPYGSQSSVFPEFIYSVSKSKWLCNFEYSHGGTTLYGWCSQQCHRDILERRVRVDRDKRLWVGVKNEQLLFPSPPPHTGAYALFR